MQQIIKSLSFKDSIDKIILTLKGLQQNNTEHTTRKTCTPKIRLECLLKKMTSTPRLILSVTMTTWMSSEIHKLQLTYCTSVLCQLNSTKTEKQNKQTKNDACLKEKIYILPEWSHGMERREAISTWRKEEENREKGKTTLIK